MKVQEDRGLLCGVVCRVAHRTGLEEAVTGLVDRRLVRLDIGELASRHAPNSRADMMV